MKIIKIIPFINDFLILNFALIESKFWAIFFGQNFTFEFFFGWSVNQNRLDPISGDFNSETIAILTGETFFDIVLRFALGVMVFFVIKFLLSMIFSKSGLNQPNVSS